MSPQEFEDAWEHLMSKLSPKERELVETTVSGAEVNHSLVYAGIAFVLGVFGGWVLT